MNLFDWAEHYKPGMTAAQPSEFSMIFPEGEGMESVRKLIAQGEAARVWTLLNRNGEYLIADGCRYVHRVAYLITEIPFTPGDDWPDGLLVPYGDDEQREAWAIAVFDCETALTYPQWLAERENEPETDMAREVG